MAENTLVLYTNPMSRGRVVRWMLEETGCAYETHLLDYGTTMKASDYLAINPMGKVPALAHGKAIITETVAICAYLADTFPQANLGPAANDQTAKADYYRWLFFIAGPLESAIAGKMLGAEVPADKQGFIGYGNFDLMLGTLESALRDKTFISGNRFSAADLVASSYLSFYMQFGTIPANTVFEQYVKTHKSRPACLRAEQTDDALMNKSKAG